VIGLPPPAQIGRPSTHPKAFHTSEGLTGVGQSTGDVYRFVGAARQNLTVVGATEGTPTSSFSYTGPGPRNNVTLQGTSQVTYNANGTQTVFLSNVSLECK
jgi:hypothetical protein